MECERDTEGGALRGRRDCYFFDPRQKGLRDSRDRTAGVRCIKGEGYNPVNQLVGYILSEDPTYITTYKGARSLIRKVDRDDLLQAMLRSYLNV